MTKERQAYRLAFQLIREAKAAVTPHLDPHLYAPTFQDLTHLLHDLNQLAIEGSVKRSSRSSLPSPRRPTGL